MTARLNILDQRFHRLLVLSDDLTSTDKRKVWCRCDCGKICSISVGHLTNGHTKSCGCYKIHGLTKHGRSTTRTYRIWLGMVKRATGKFCPTYYFDRGIKVTKRWLTFENFLADMGEAPEGRSLDRKNNNLGYSKRNCRWATRTEQARNTRSNRMLTFRGETLCFAAMAEKWGQTKATLSGRLLAGWTLERALVTPVKQKMMLEFDGKMLSIFEWSKVCGMSACAITQRLKIGWSVERTLTTPIRK